MVKQAHKQINALACLLSSALISTSCTRQESVSVYKQPMFVGKVELVPLVADKGDEKPEHHRTASTEWRFTLEPELGFDVVKSAHSGNYHVVSIKVKEARLKIGLPITMFITRKAPKLVSDHEYGHVEICRRFYLHAQNDARKAGQSVVGKTFSGSGDSHREALARALMDAGAAVGKEYNILVADPSMRVSDAYDRICAQLQCKLEVAQAIDKAFAEVRAQNSLSKGPAASASSR
ncbi:MAG TPA: hypothetical protein V6D17_17815 [Candidatus Obscuribacterales bacterium]